MASLKKKSVSDGLCAMTLGSVMATVGVAAGDEAAAEVASHIITQESAGATALPAAGPPGTDQVRSITQWPRWKSANICLEQTEKFGVLLNGELLASIIHIFKGNADSSSLRKSS